MMVMVLVGVRMRNRGAHNIPLMKINPHYTPQECSYCGVIGTREKETFICNNKRCCNMQEAIQPKLSSMLDIP